MNTEHLRTVIEQHQSMVFSIALRVVRDYGLAEEVAQDVFLELFRADEAQFQSDDHRRFWLRRVAVHRATDAIRRLRRQPESLADEWMEEQHAPVSISASGLPDVTVDRLETMVGSLPEAMRVAVVLRYGEEMTPGEIGTLLDQPLATVKSNLQRALKLLRQKAAITLKGYVREH